MSERFAHNEAVFGRKAVQDLRRQRVLCVGAGGIGVELLKNLAQLGIGWIDVVDLDTIEVSNLNRQFLFRHEHVGMSKAQVAAEAIAGYLDGVTVQGGSNRYQELLQHHQNRQQDTCPPFVVAFHHGNIFDTAFDVEFFGAFDFVFSALDNVSARQQVNRMCLAADVDHMEAGTAGFTGQTYAVLKGHFTRHRDSV
ncbi:MAG: hypothetical protein MHM6MM_007700, partial [Cercozoa sp. M6MM]